MTSHTPSPVLLDLLGDAYTQTKDLAKAEAAYRQASELDPSELSHLRGLGQTLDGRRKISPTLFRLSEACDLMPDDADIYLAHGADLSRAASARSSRRESAEGPAVCAGQPGSHVQRGDAVRGAGPLRRCHSRALGRDRRREGAIDRAAVAPALAGDSVSSNSASFIAIARIIRPRLTPTTSWATSATKKIAARAC